MLVVLSSGLSSSAQLHRVSYYSYKFLIKCNSLINYCYTRINVCGNRKVL
jgi:hypothetical protein